jgi:hypothetical protein
MSPELGWVELSGNGKLWSFTRIWAAPEIFQKEAPYIIGIIDLDEGLRLMSRLRASYDYLKIDMSMRVTYVDITSEITVFNFEPA